MNKKLFLFSAIAMLFLSQSGGFCYPLFPHLTIENHTEFTLKFTFTGQSGKSKHLHTDTIQPGGHVGFRLKLNKPIEISTIHLTNPSKNIQITFGCGNFNLDAGKSAIVKLKEAKENAAHPFGCSRVTY